MLRISEQNEQKASEPRVSSMGIFRESAHESKFFLINKLNIEFIKINNLINSMNAGPRKDTMKYLLGASSFEDPYQLELMKKNIDEELAELEAQRGLLTFRKCLTWSLCSLGLTINSLIYQDVYGQIQIGADNNMPFFWLLSSVAGGAATIRAYDIESRISNLINIKNIISGLLDDNQKLSRFLNSNNLDELRFRQDFFERHILSVDRAEQVKKMRDEPVHYTEWNPNESLIIPSRVGIAYRN